MQIVKVLNDLILEQGGDYFAEQDKADLLNDGQALLDILSKEGFPFADDEAYMGHIISPTIGIDGKVIGMGLELSSEAQSALTALFLLIDNLFG